MKLKEIQELFFTSPKREKGCILSRKVSGRKTTAYRVEKMEHNNGISTFAPVSDWMTEKEFIQYLTY